MPHLNEINEKYGSRGLKIVAVSREKEGVIADFVRSQRVGYGVAQSSVASGYYGVSGIPDAFIVGKDGKVLWRGHPGYINDEMLAAWLGGQPLPADAPVSSSGGSSAFSAFFKLGMFILLSGVAVFFVLRLLKPRNQGPVYPTKAWPQQGGPTAPPAQPGGSAPAPVASNNCPHCGSPKREGRKNCMGCGAPL